MQTDFQSLLPFLAALKRQTDAPQDDDDSDAQSGASVETQLQPQAGAPAVQTKGNALLRLLQSGLTSSAQAGGATQSGDPNQMQTALDGQNGGVGGQDTLSPAGSQVVTVNGGPSRIPRLATVPDVPQDGPDVSPDLAISDPNQTRATLNQLMQGIEQSPRPGKPPSGGMWSRQFPTSSSTNDLDPDFRQNVEDFLNALDDAHATYNINATLRPPERAYLMHYAYRVAREGMDPATVPEMNGVPIDWVHRDAKGVPDLAASRAAAEEMVRAFNIVYRPALTSRHSEGKAVDMNIHWSGPLTIRNANGEMVTIRNGPRDGSNQQLQDVGATYGVNKLQSDPPHWSSDGH